MATWRKSTYSNTQGNCIEVAALTGTVAIRDSKSPEAGHLSLSAEAFTALVAKVKRDELSL